MPWRLLARAEALVDLCRRQALLGLIGWPALVLVVVEALGDGQPVAFFQRLRRLNRLRHFPLAEPDASVQADAARNDVDVVVLGVVVPDDDAGVLVGKPHLLHEVGGHFIPLFGGQTLSRRQRQRAVP